MAVKTIETRAVISAQDKTGATFSQVAQRLKGLEQTAVSASRKMDSVARGMDSVGRAKAFHAAIADRMGAAGIAAAANARVGGINARIGGIRSRLTDFAAGATPGMAGAALGLGGSAVAGLGVGAAATYGLRKAISFERSMADIKKKLDLPPGATWDDVEKMVNDNSRALGISREDMAALAAQAAQAGISFKDLGGFMTVSARAASAWDVSAKDAAQTLSEIRAQTGWTIKELGDYADKVNYLGDISAAAEKNISEMWSRASSGAKAAGVGYEDSMAALTAMKSVGMEPEVASRAFGQFSSRLRTASTQNKDFKAAAKAMGFSPKQLEEGMKKDGMGTILTILDKMAKSKDSVKLATGLGGKEWWDEFLRMKDAAPEMTRLRGGLASGKWQGSLGQALQVDLATTENHLKRFGALTSEIGDKLTRWALPSLNDGLEKTLKLFEKAQSDGILPTAAKESPAIASALTTFDNVQKQGALPYLNRLVVDASKTPSSSWSMPGWMSSGISAVGDAFANNPWSRLSAMADKIDADKLPGAVKAANAFGVGAGRSGVLGFGLGGAQNPITPVAKLEGSARIENTLRIEPSEMFKVFVDQRIQAEGALRNDSGVTMQP